jgi:hypothetical protein
MSRSIALTCAAVLLCALAGCSLHSLLMPGHDDGRHVKVVAGGIKEVAAMLQTGLEQAGIAVPLDHVKRIDGEIRIAAQAKSGQVFCLDIKPDAGRNDQSIVTVRWDRKADEDLWKTVIDILNITDIGEEKN